MQAIARSGSEIVQTAKTNAVRLLDRLGVRYELGEYEVDPDDLAAETIARKVGSPPRAGLQDPGGPWRQAQCLPVGRAQQLRA